MSQSSDTYNLPFTSSDDGADSQQSSDANAGVYDGVLHLMAGSAATCQQSTVFWTWSGREDPTASVSLAIQRLDNDTVDTNTKRSIKMKRPTRRHTELVARAGAPINVAGSVPLSSNRWSWDTSVDAGRYRWVATVVGSDIMATSSPFTVARGSDISCLPGGGTDTDSSTTSDNNPSTSTAAPTSTDVSPASNSSASKPSSAPTTGSSTSPAALPASKDHSADNGGGGGGGGISSGAIAAAVLVPLLALAALAILCLRRRASSASRRERSGSNAWSEKFFTAGAGAAGALKKKKHNRNISEPMDPIHSAGLAMHDADIREQMRNAAHGDATLTSADHTIDFSQPGSPDAQPITPSQFAHLAGRPDDAGRFSLQSQTSSAAPGRAGVGVGVGAVAGLYMHENRNLGRDSSLTTPAQKSHFSQSTTNTDPRASARRDSAVDDPFTNDSAVIVTAHRQPATVAAPAVTVTRTDSAVRRKPVPSFHSDSDVSRSIEIVDAREDMRDDVADSVGHATVRGTEESPFSDSNEVRSSSPTHSSSGNEKEDTDEVLAPPRAPFALPTPHDRSSRGSGFPESAKGSDSPSLDMDDYASAADHDRPPFAPPNLRTLLEAPQDSIARAGSSPAALQEQDQFKLSVHLGEDDFRFSFPGQ